MNRLGEMEAFVAVVEQGGFTDAARRLGISKSAVSKHVSALENRLNVRLLNRTTRKVSPTEIGTSYYEKALHVINEARAADDLVTAMQQEPKGTLRVSVPVDIGLQHFSAALGEFLQQYPDVTVNLLLDNSKTELISEGVDVAVRFGFIEDSSLRMRKLSNFRRPLVASPDYLKRHGIPEAIEDLSQHDLLQCSHLHSGGFWNLKTPSGEERLVRVKGPLTTTSGTSLMYATLSGLGIAKMPDFICGPALESGALVEVLPQLPQEYVDIHALYLPGKFVHPTLRLFIDFLVDFFKDFDPSAPPVSVRTI